jgi:hypothetical protein
MGLRQVFPVQTNSKVLMRARGARWVPSFEASTPEFEPRIPNRRPVQNKAYFHQTSVSEKLPQGVSCRISAVVCPRCRKLASCVLEVFAEVCEMFIGNGFRAPFAAMVGGIEIVKSAIRADSQIRSALGTRLASSGWAPLVPNPPALMAMRCQHKERMTENYCQPKLHL